MCILRFLLKLPCKYGPAAHFIWLQKVREVCDTTVLLGAVDTWCCLVLSCLKSFKGTNDLLRKPQSFFVLSVFILTKPSLIYTVLVDLLGQSNLNCKNFWNLKLFLLILLK